MNLSRFALAAVMAAATGLTSAQAYSDPATPGAHHRHARFHHDGGGLPLARLIHKLELSDAQRQSIKGILDASAEQRKALREQQRAAREAARSTLPDDPNYPALVETHKQLASTAIQQRSDLNVQIYSLLTSEQKAQIPQLVAEMKSHAKERRKERNSMKEADSG